ncbi:MAG: D-alanyl-D-alanine carboxypeptidase family protein [Magnetococcales bacterium]|nr:D-alanyl-D-alanine carboxypeptidase family protein [Magnetococcales bacterium]
MGAQINRRDFVSVLSAATLGSFVASPAAAQFSWTLSAKKKKFDSHLDYQEYLEKIRKFNKVHESDLYLPPDQIILLKSTTQRFNRLQRLVGHANFHLLGFDDALKLSRSYTQVESFTPEELVFLERLFHETADHYGFFGQKPIKKLTDRIPRREVVKIRRSGNYLYKGKPVEMYKRIKKDLGKQVILTSGIRSVIKQFFLFLSKTEESNGNLSLASRSLAPPGYSFHGIGDFDVGQVGYGKLNFTAQFAKTEVFSRLQELGYIDLRYNRDNKLGVRFEPWHVKVVS